MSTPRALHRWNARRPCASWAQLAANASGLTTGTTNDARVPQRLAPRLGEQVLHEIEQRERAHHLDPVHQPREQHGLAVRRAQLVAADGAALDGASPR